MGEVATFQEGYVNPSQKVPAYFGGNIKWLRASDLNNSYVYDTERKLTIKGLESAGANAACFDKDTIVISKSGTIGRLGILKDEMYGNRATINIKNKSSIKHKYLFYQLLWKNAEIQELAVGSVQRNLYISNLASLFVRLPPLPEQKAIADTLSVLDDKIELNKQINANLEAQAQDIFKHWFIEFEFPDENGQPYKSSGGEMEESELGMIPKGWEVKSLDEVASFLNGVAIAKYRPEEIVDETLPAVKIRELRQGYTDSDSDRCLLDVDKKFYIDDYDMIFSWSGTLLIDIWVGGRAILNQHLFKVTSDKYRKWFYYYWTKFHLGRFISIARDRATTMGHIRRTNLSAAKVLVPTPIHYNNMELLACILDEKAKLSKQNQTLSQLRDTLLPKLMSGEIRIPLD